LSCKGCLTKWINKLAINLPEDIDKDDFEKLAHHIYDEMKPADRATFGIEWILSRLPKTAKTTGLRMALEQLATPEEKKVNHEVLTDFPFNPEDHIMDMIDYYTHKIFDADDSAEED